jgi:hypothetical protein
LNIFIAFVLQSLAVVPMLYLHRASFKRKEVVRPGTLREKDRLDMRDTFIAAVGTNTEDLTSFRE